MKLLIMCEGPNELKIINILLENQKLKFSSDDLLGLVPYHARQIKSSAAVKAALNLYPDEVHVLRIGDGQNEKLEIPSAYKDKITLVEKYNYLRDYEMFTALVEQVSEGIFGFSSEEAYQRELNKENHPSKKRKKFGRR